MLADTPPRNGSHERATAGDVLQFLLRLNVVGDDDFVFANGKPDDRPID